MFCNVTDSESFQQQDQYISGGALYWDNFGIVTVFTAAEMNTVRTRMGAWSHGKILDLENDSMTPFLGFLTAKTKFILRIVSVLTEVD